MSVDVSAASSATGRSAVPAVKTRTPSTALPSPAVRNDYGIGPFVKVSLRYQFLNGIVGRSGPSW